MGSLIRPTKENKGTNGFLIEHPGLVKNVSNIDPRIYREQIWMDPYALDWAACGSIPTNMWFKYIASQNLIDKLYDKVTNETVGLDIYTKEEKYKLGWFDQGCWYKPKDNWEEIYDKILLEQKENETIESE